jgi:hypothetical protein
MFGRWRRSRNAKRKLLNDSRKHLWRVQSFRGGWRAVNDNNETVCFVYKLEDAEEIVRAHNAAVS